MQIKCFELVDRSTFIPVIAIAVIPENEKQNYLCHRVGFNIKHNVGIIMMRLSDQRATSNPKIWGDRTHQTAHKYIIEKWDELEDGDVIDVEFILNETKEPKQSNYEKYL